MRIKARRIDESSSSTIEQVDLPSDIETNIHQACLYSDEKALTSLANLLKNGTDPNLRCNASRETPLHLAVRHALGEHVKLLLAQPGIQVNSVLYQDSTTPLHVACQLSRQSNNTRLERCKKSEIAKMLIDHGADVNAGDVNDMTPLFYAAKNCLPINVKQLLESGARPDLVPAVSAACRYMSQDYRGPQINRDRLEIVEILLKHDALDDMVCELIDDNGDSEDLGYSQPYCGLSMFYDQDVFQIYLQSGQICKNSKHQISCLITLLIKREVMIDNVLMGLHIERLIQMLQSARETSGIELQHFLKQEDFWRENNYEIYQEEHQELVERLLPKLYPLSLLEIARIALLKQLPKGYQKRAHIINNNFSQVIPEMLRKFLLFEL